jgi:hypothetical protein
LHIQGRSFLAALRHAEIRVLHKAAGETLLTVE